MFQFYSMNFFLQFLVCFWNYFDTSVDYVEVYMFSGNLSLVGTKYQ